MIEPWVIRSWIALGAHRWRSPGRWQCAGDQCQQRSERPISLRAFFHVCGEKEDRWGRVAAGVQENEPIGPGLSSIGG